MPQRDRPDPAPPPAASTAPAPAARWPRSRRNGVLWLAALGLAAGGLWLWRDRDTVHTSYLTRQADIGTVAPAVLASGTVNPVTTVQVGSYVSGVIQTLWCDFNTKVRAGQTCARIDARPYQSAVDQAAANVAIARAQREKDRFNLVLAKQILDRNSDLLKRGFVSQEAADTAANAWRQALGQIALDEATVQQHQAALDAARINLGFTNIASPVDGTVVTRNVTQGQTVAASFQTPTLFLIATDLTRMQVDTNVSESDIGRVAEGNHANFTVDAFPDHTFFGTVRQLRQAPQTVQNVITYDVVVGVANPDLLLKPGMTASVRIITQQRDKVLRVPHQALRYMPAGGDQAGKTGGTPSALPGAVGHGDRETQVWVVRKGRTGPPERVPVMIGLDDDAYAEVRGGALHPGDRVVVSERGAAPARTGAAAAGAPAPRL